MARFELTPEEIKLFVEEAVEQLQRMEDGLISLEENPDDTDLIQEIFRAAHTLKGGAATAGFTNMAELTHAMESLLDMVRQGKAAMSPQLGDYLLRGVDVLRACVAAIEQEGTADGVDVREAIALFSEAAAGLASGERGPSASRSAKRAEAAAEPQREGGEPLLGFVVKIAPDALMPAVRAYQVLLAVEDVAPVVGSRPDREAIEQGAGDVSEVTIYIPADTSFDAVKAALREVPEVASVELLASGQAEDDAPGQPAASAQPKREQEETADGMEGSAGGAARGEAQARPAREEPEGQAAAADGTRGAAAGELGQTIRVDVRLLDTLMNLVGELVIDRTRLVQLAGADMSLHDLQEELTQVSSRLSRVTSDLQDCIMRARMMPVDMLFKRFPRMVRDLSRQLNKPINFVMTGQETELDRSVIEQIGDPLIHLLRNAVDHGIEPVEERRRLGKPDEGLVRLAAYHQENHIYIEVSDDGRGLDIERLKQRAVEKGLLPADEAELLSPEEAAELIFLPGLSTAQGVSSVSGRGVGMDVVKKNIEKVNGSVSVRTRKGEGTTVTIKLPLTLAILQSLMVEIAGQIFAIPLVNVTEAVRAAAADIRRVKGWDMISVRGEMTPLLNPGTVWGDEWTVGRVAQERGEDASPNGTGFPVVILRSGSAPIGLRVDRLIGEQEIVVKSMGPIIGDVPGVSGASILGDGRVALIIDLASLSKAVKEFARA